MRLSPLDIEHMEFPRSAAGYHRGHVREFLQRVAADAEEMLREMQTLRAKLEESERRVEELQTAEAELQRAVIAAERIGNLRKENARREAQLVLQEAERLRERRLADVEGSIHRARLELDRLERDRNLFREQFRGLLEAYLRSLEATTAAAVERETAERETAERETTERETVERETAERETADPASALLDDAVGS